MPRGLFVTVEGGEGVGKSTNLRFIEDYLRRAGKSVVMTREPGGTRLGEQLRDILLDAAQNDIQDDTELLLMFAARAQHLAELIRPSLQEGKWVVCDRFTDATYAYQGAGRGINADRILTLENWVQGELRPDLTLLLDVPVHIGMQRAGERSEPDRFEQEKLDFFEQVRTCYLKRAGEDPARFRVIDASTDLPQVQAQIAEALSSVIK